MKKLTSIFVVILLIATACLSFGCEEKGSEENNTFPPLEEENKSFLAWEEMPENTNPNFKYFGYYHFSDAIDEVAAMGNANLAKVDAEEIEEIAHLAAKNFNILIMIRHIFFEDNINITEYGENVMKTKNSFLLLILIIFVLVTLTVILLACNNVEDNEKRGLWNYTMSAVNNAFSEADGYSADISVELESNNHSYITKEYKGKMQLDKNNSDPLMLVETENSDSEEIIKSYLYKDMIFIYQGESVSSANTVSLSEQIFSSEAMKLLDEYEPSIKRSILRTDFIFNLPDEIASGIIRSFGLPTSNQYECKNEVIVVNNFTKLPSKIYFEIYSLRDDKSVYTRLCYEMKFTSFKKVTVEKPDEVKKYDQILSYLETVEDFLAPGDASSYTLTHRYATDPKHQITYQKNNTASFLKVIETEYFLGQITTKGEYSSYLVDGFSYGFVNGAFDSVQEEKSLGNRLPQLTIYKDTETTLTYDVYSGHFSLTVRPKNAMPSVVLTLNGNAYNVYTVATLNITLNEEGKLVNLTLSSNHSIDIAIYYHTDVTISLPKEINEVKDNGMLLLSDSLHFIEDAEYLSTQIEISYGGSVYSAFGKINKPMKQGYDVFGNLIGPYKCYDIQAETDGRSRYEIYLRDNTHLNCYKNGLLTEKATQSNYALNYFDFELCKLITLSNISTVQKTEDEIIVILKNNSILNERALARWGLQGESFTVNEICIKLLSSGKIDTATYTFTTDEGEITLFIKYAYPVENTIQVPEHTLRGFDISNISENRFTIASNDQFTYCPELNAIVAFYGAQGAYNMIVYSFPSLEVLYIYTLNQEYIYAYQILNTRFVCQSDTYIYYFDLSAFQPPKVFSLQYYIHSQLLLTKDMLLYYSNTTLYSLNVTDSSVNTLFTDLPFDCQLAYNVEHNILYIHHYTLLAYCLDTVEEVFILQNFGFGDLCFDKKRLTVGQSILHPLTGEYLSSVEEFNLRYDVSSGYSTAYTYYENDLYALTSIYIGSIDYNIRNYGLYSFIDNEYVEFFIDTYIVVMPNDTFYIKNYGKTDVIIFET